MKTRTTKKTQAKASDASQESAALVKSLSANETNPPLVFMLPEKRSPEARIVTLPNPANSVASRYYVCPDQGVFEFTKIGAPKKTPRSWLLAPLENDDGEKSDYTDEDQEKQAFEHGYTIEQPDLFIATPIDPLFLLLPALTGPDRADNKNLFLSIDDHIDVMTVTSKQLRHVLRSENSRSLIERRAHAVCDSVDVGDEKMYRLSEQRLGREILNKAQKMVDQGLPVSLQQRYVHEALQAPARVVARTEIVDLENPAISVQSDANCITESQSSVDSSSVAVDSQSTDASMASTSTTATSVSSALEHRKEGISTEVVNSLRLRTAFQYMLSAYIAPSVRERLQAWLTGPDATVDFTALDEHLAQIAKLRREAQALRSLSDNISRKRSNFGDDEAEEVRAEKRRKKEEEEAKKKSQSRATKQLAKVNTSGMQKLSSFFAKAPAKKAKS